MITPQEHTVLVALRGGPMDGRVVTAPAGAPLVEITSPALWGRKVHRYRVRTPEDEIVEAEYEET